MLASLLAKLGLGAAPLAEVFQPLLKALQPLDSVESGLADKVVAFILDGQGPEVLLRLQNDAAIKGEMLYQPGRLSQRLWAQNFASWSQSLNNQAAYNAGKKSAYNRSLFYEYLKEDAVSPAMLVRLGKVLQAVDKGQSLERSGLDAPDWLEYLINDVVFSGTKDSGDRNTVPERPGWSLALIERIVAEEGLSPVLPVLMPFECKGISQWVTSPRRYMLRWAGSEEWLLSHADSLRSHIEKLSAAGKCELLDLLGEKAGMLSAFPDVFITLAVDAGKTVRDQAVPLLALIPEEHRIAGLKGLLQNGNTKSKLQAVDLLGREQHADAKSVLEEALATAPGAALEAAIKNALTRLDASANIQSLAELPVIEIEDIAPLSESVYQLLYDNWQQLRVEKERQASAEIERNKAPDLRYKPDWQQKNWQQFQKVNESKIRELFTMLNGDSVNSKKFMNSFSREIANHKGRLAEHAEVKLGHIIKLVSLCDQLNWLGSSDYLRNWLAKQAPGTVGLRHIAAYFHKLGLSTRYIAYATLNEWSGWGNGSFVDMLSGEAIWHFFAEEPQWLEEALGMRPSSGKSGYGNDFDARCAMRVLNLFPVIPPQFVARVLELALGENKTHRQQAQEIASRFSNIVPQVCEQLNAGKQDHRNVAASWLARLGDKSAIPALYAALGKEKNETVRATLLTSLEKLGEDIYPYLSPETLRAEADKGVKGKLPAGLDWFPLDSLPPACWAVDGTPVAPVILRWWIILAFKLKEPAGNALIERYLGLLEPSSAAGLGRFILHEFISHDTRNPSSEEAASYAQANAQSRLQMYHNWAKYTPEYANKTLEECLEELRREKLGTYLGSAISAKGILALMARAPAHEVVSQLRAYMRDHYTRTAQITAMLEASANSNDPILIQFLLAISRRYRTAGVQEKARHLVERVAERKQWTHDQLADRTIPTAGFDESGVLTIEYGERRFTVTLDADMKPVLRNAEGKEIKALPEARKADAPESIKEGKQLWSSSKKELKQIIELQSNRLYEAMCSGRLWPVAEWREYLWQHPIMGRLVQQLVWLQTDAEGSVRNAFRPTEDGSLLDSDDEEVSLADEAFIRLAHTSLLDLPQHQAWLMHLKDYKVKPLFVQLGRPQPKLENPELLTQITEREGWLSDAFTLRGHFNKLGYQRAAAEDGGFFTHYFKEYNSVGIRVCMEFTGNCLPEENVAAAMTCLYFEKMDGNRWNTPHLHLSEVPPVLLGESYADYLKIADAGSFDADWQKKTPW